MKRTGLTQGFLGVFGGTGWATGLFFILVPVLIVTALWNAVDVLLTTSKISEQLKQISEGEFITYSGNMVAVKYLRSTDGTSLVVQEIDSIVDSVHEITLAQVRAISQKNDIDAIKILDVIEEVVGNTTDSLFIELPTMDPEALGYNYSAARAWIGPEGKQRLLDVLIADRLLQVSTGNASRIVLYVVLLVISTVLNILAIVAYVAERKRNIILSREHILDKSAILEIAALRSFYQRVSFNWIAMTFASFLALAGLGLVVFAWQAHIAESIAVEVGAFKLTNASTGIVTMLFGVSLIVLLVRLKPVDVSAIGAKGGQGEV